MAFWLLLRLKLLQEPSGFGPTDMQNQTPQEIIKSPNSVPVAAQCLVHKLILPSKSITGDIKIFVQNTIFSRLTDPSFWAICNRNQTIIFVQPCFFPGYFFYYSTILSVGSFHANSLQWVHQTSWIFFVFGGYVDTYTKNPCYEFVITMVLLQIIARTRNI